MFTLAVTLVLLAAAALGAAASCDATKDEKFHQCYGAVGQPLFLHLLNDTIGYEISLKNSRKERILTFKNGNTTYYTCCFFFNNGTLRVDKATKNDSKEYNLEIHDSDGMCIQSRKIQLSIEEPVSSPVVSTLCLPHGALRLSCSATGDSPQYSWTLEDEAVGSGNFDDGNGVIILKKNESRNVTCTVWNHISRANTTLTLPTCTGTGASTNCSALNGVTNCSESICEFVSIGLGVAFILSVLSIITYFHFKKKCSHY